MNLLLWLSACFLAGSGLAVFFKLPPGSQGGHGLTLWGLGRHDWGDLHAWVGIVFIALIIAHMIMAWPWLKNAAAKKRLWPVLLGIAAGLAIVAGILTGPVEQTAHKHGHRHDKEQTAASNR